MKSASKRFSTHLWFNHFPNCQDLARPGFVLVHCSAAFEMILSKVLKISFSLSGREPLSSCGFLSTTSSSSDLSSSLVAMRAFNAAQAMYSMGKASTVWPSLPSFAYQAQARHPLSALETGLHPRMK